jgi:hypothetical protein
MIPNIAETLTAMRFAVAPIGAALRKKGKFVTLENAQDI